MPSQLRKPTVFWLHGQQAAGHDPDPELCADEPSPRVLHPDVESLVQERCGPVRAHLEEGHKNDPRDRTAPLQGQAESWGCSI